MKQKINYFIESIISLTRSSFSSISSSLILASATTFSGALSGNATTATAWATARTITLTGDVTGVSGSWTGSGNISFATTVGNDSHSHGDSTINGLDASAITTGTLSRPTSSSSASCTGNAATVTNGVYTSRTISTTAPLTGGGNLSTNRTIAISAATASVNGYMTSTYASKLDGIAASADVNVATNISWTAGTTAGPRCNSSTGSDSVIPTASATASGAVTTGSQTFAGTKTFKFEKKLSQDVEFIRLNLVGKSNIYSISDFYIDKDS